MKKTKQPILTVFTLSLMLLTLLWQISCKKSDLEFQSKRIATTEQEFFKAADGVPPEVEKVVNEFRRQSKNTRFLKELMLSDGIPLWQKAKIRIERKKNSLQKDNTSDTMVIIPMVQEGENEIYSYIEAHISGDVSLQLHRKNDYSTYAFSSDDSMMNEAEIFALRFMDLSREVFGHSKFKILDSRLFKTENETEYPGQKFVVLKEETSGSGTGKMVYKQLCADLIFTTNTCPFNPCSGDGGSCDNCGLCTTTKTFTSCTNWWEDDGTGGGGGGGNGDGSGGGGGDGGGTTPPNPCGTGGIIVNGKVPCPPTNDDGGWVPSDEEMGYPPFIWAFTGDDGTTFTDGNPLNQPEFRFDPLDNYETLYPRFTNMVKNLKTFVKENPKVLTALQTYSGFTKQQIIDHLTFGKGPLIKVVELHDVFATYNGTKMPEILQIRASYVRGLEQSQLQTTKEATAFLLAVTILHEFVHYGTTHNNISEGVYDFGFGFERDAFNVIVNEKNAGKIVIEFQKYFK